MEDDGCTCLVKPDDQVLVLCVFVLVADENRSRDFTNKLIFCRFLLWVVFDKFSLEKKQKHF